MLNLEERINHVRHPEARTLVTEAYRCYSTGSARAAIVLTWSAVCADIIRKLHQLAEDGEGAAATLVRKIDDVLSKGGNAEAIKEMQQIESGLLQAAADLELIDHVEQRQLEQLRQDRHLCAHPSLLPMGELFSPSLDYARAHLSTALEALLVHPPSQGRKVVARFVDYVADPSFVISEKYVTQTFSERVKPTVRRQIFELAAKHAVLELDVEGHDSTQIAGRLAGCLRVFSEHQRDAVHEAVLKTVGRLDGRPTDVQLRALGRLGDLDVFSSSLDAAMWQHYDGLIRAAVSLPPPGSLDYLEPGLAQVLALARVESLRRDLPALEQTLAVLSARQMLWVVLLTQDRYLVSHLVPVIRGIDQSDATAFGSALVELWLPVLDDALLGEVLMAWAESDVFRIGVGEDRLKRLFLLDISRPSSPAWPAFIRKVRELEPEGSPFRYDDLARLVRFEEAAPVGG